MPSQITNYKCPACGGPLRFAGDSGKLQCDYCGSAFDLAEIESQMSDAEAKAAEAFDKETGKASGDSDKASGDSGKASGDSGKASGESGDTWDTSGLNSDWGADADITFHATQSSSRREGKYEVTTTRHYDVRRAGSVEFERVPVDASKRMPDDMMDSIEPFDYGELKPFSTAYLPGFLADRYDVSIEESARRADERCSNTVVDMLESTVTGYETVSLESKDVRIQRGKVHYALLPVWLLHTKWAGKDFLFGMNAQSGKMVGNLPINWVKFWLTFAGIFAPLTALAYWFFMT